MAVRLHLLLLLLSVLPVLAAIARLQALFDRAKFNQYAQAQGLRRVAWAPEPPSARLALAYFEWLEQAASTGDPSVLATPRLSVRAFAAAPAHGP